MRQLVGMVVGSRLSSLTKCLFFSGRTQIRTVGFNRVKVGSRPPAGPKHRVFRHQPAALVTGSFTESPPSGGSTGGFEGAGGGCVHDLRGAS